MLVREKKQHLLVHANNIFYLGFPILLGDGPLPSLYDHWDLTSGVPIDPENEEKGCIVEFSLYSCTLRYPVVQGNATSSIHLHGRTAVPWTFADWAQLYREKL